MGNREGQYWTPEQAEYLIRWWNKNDDRQAEQLTDEHRHFLENADLARGSDVPHTFIGVGECNFHLGAFLSVSEMHRSQVTGTAFACSAIHKASHEIESRWVECLVPGVIAALGLPLVFDVHEHHRSE